MNLPRRKPRGKAEGTHRCRIHGKQLYVKSDVAHGEVCIECVRSGMYVREVEAEFKARYPRLMNPF